MARKRLSKFIKCSVLIIVVLGLLFVHFVLPRAIIQKRSSIKLPEKSERFKKYDSIISNNTDFKRKKLTIESYDGLKLSALLTYSNLGVSKGTIILIHSSGSTKYKYFEMSETLSSNGFNAVSVDVRGFGESEGQFFTFGVEEKKDITSVINYLIEKEQLTNIGVWGQSIGGAIAMQAMAFDKRIKFGIIESTFTDFKTNMDTYFTRISKIHIEPLANYVVHRAGTIGNFDADDASPLKYAEKITQPTLLVHGEKDQVINIKYARQNFAKIKSANKRLLEIDSATHSNLWQIGGDTYMDQVLDFININTTFN